MKKLSILFILLVTYTSAWSQGKEKHDVKVISSVNAPKAIGPYSQAVRTGRMIYTSGQIGLIPETGAMAGEDIIAQAHQALKNIKALVESAGTDMNHVVKVTIFLKDLNDFSKVNEIYATYFPDVKPARSTVQVARLPKDALIEIECIATEK